MEGVDDGLVSATGRCAPEDCCCGGDIESSMEFTLARALNSKRPIAACWLSAMSWEKQLSRLQVSQGVCFSAGLDQLHRECMNAKTIGLYIHIRLGDSVVPEQSQARKKLLLGTFGLGLGRGALLATVSVRLVQSLVPVQIRCQRAGTMPKLLKGGPPVRGAVLVAMAVVEGVEDGQQGRELGGEADVGRGRCDAEVHGC